MLRLVVLVLLVTIPAAAAPGLVAGPARVIDGDTIDLAGERLRLIGSTRLRATRSPARREGLGVR